jgi:hypothetical protein
MTVGSKRRIGTLIRAMAEETSRDCPEKPSASLPPGEKVGPGREQAQGHEGGQS